MMPLELLKYHLIWLFYNLVKREMIRDYVHLFTQRNTYNKSYTQEHYIDEGNV